MSTEAILAQIDDALDDWSVGPDAMRSGAPVGNRGLMPMRPNTVTPEQLAGLTVSITAAFQPFVAAMAKLGRSIVAIGEARPPRDEHHPPPLCIDGHAYHRRRKARTRRGR